MHIVNILEGKVSGFHQILTEISDSNRATQTSRITSSAPQLPSFAQNPKDEVSDPCKAAHDISCDQCLSPEKGNKSFHLDLN